MWIARPVKIIWLVGISDNLKYLKLWVPEIHSKSLLKIQHKIFRLIYGHIIDFVAETLRHLGNKPTSTSIPNWTTTTGQWATTFMYRRQIIWIFRGRRREDAGDPNRSDERYLFVRHRSQRQFTKLCIRLNPEYTTTTDRNDQCRSHTSPGDQSARWLRLLAADRNRCGLRRGDKPGMSPKQYRVHY